MSIVRSEILIEFPYTHSTGPIVGESLAALRAGGLLGARCESCDAVNVPAREWCELCGGETSAMVPVGPGGVVTLQSGLWALIRLDGADTDLIHRVQSPIAAGARVHPVWSAKRIGSITDIEGFAPGEAPEGQGVSHAHDERTIGNFARNVSLPYSLSAGVLLSRFFNDIREHRIINGVRCTSCAVVIVPPAIACARCWADTDGWIPLADRGVVTTFVVVNVPFHGQQMPLPYVLARILLDGADTSFLHVLGEVAHTEVRMGMRVEAVWRDARTGFLNDDVEYFRPAREPDVPTETFVDRL